MTAVCPECTGPRVRSHPAGLVFDHHRRCALLAAEDARKAADEELIIDAGGWEVRPITDTEATLLAACGAPAGAIPPRTIVAAAVAESRPSRDVTSNGVPVTPGVGPGVAIVRRSWITAGERRALDPDALDPPDTGPPPDPGLVSTPDPMSTPDPTNTEETTT